MKKNIQFLFLTAAASLVASFIGQQPALAATLAEPLAPPSTWQQSATGLLGVTAGRKTTAGLGFTVWQEDWPGLAMKAGVKDGSTFQWGNVVVGPVGIDLGQIKVPDANGAFSTERADWAHNEMTFTYGGNALRAWASRLSPAVLVQSQSNALRFLASTVSGYSFNQDGRIGKKPDAFSFPKYAALPTGGNVQVATLGTGNTALSLSSNWLLLWYSTNSHFVDTKKPLSYPGMPDSNAYQGDVPILLVFQNAPTGIKQASDGGVELAWGGAAGYVAVLPLFGRDVLRATQTAGWAAGLPADVQQRAQFWAARLCSYPVGANETYAYDDGADLATITENISSIQVCSGGTPFAPLPPMLALAKDALGITFSGTVADGNLSTEFGPSLGIDNAQSYSWKMPDLKRYADARRELGTGAVPASVGLEQELTDQVNKTVAAGHLRPWTFLDALPRHADRGDLYWANPADTLYPLIEVAQTLTDGATKQSLVAYIKAERAKYPPEDIFHLNLLEGTVRANMQTYYLDWEYHWREGRADTFLKRVPLWSFYALSKYYDLTGETPPQSVLDKASTALDRDMREQDWATSYWFDSFQDRPIAVVNANRHFAGLVGYARLATKAGDANARQLSMALLAKAAVLRVGMAKYPRFLYSAGLTELPPEHDWMVKNTAQTWNGYFFNVDWASANDDARQVTFLNQYGVYLFDHAGTKGGDANECCPVNPYLIAFRDLTPELARLLGDHAKSDAEIYIRKTKALFPHWYAAFAEGTLAYEHNMNHPVDSYQTFLAEAWISNATASDLATHADIAWLEMGDLFYMHKLAEAMNAYRGGNWGDTSLHAEVAASPSDIAANGDKITLSVQLSSDLGPITTTVRVTSVVPSGLSYVAGSLKTEPANAGTVNAGQAPTLSWQGTLDAPVTISFIAQVTEPNARLIDVAFVVEDKPGRVQTLHVKVAVNQHRVCLPLVTRD